MAEEPKCRVLVTGDYVLDHHIYEGCRHHYGDKRHRGVQHVTELGGAALVHYLVEALGGGVGSCLSVAVDENRRPCASTKGVPTAAATAYAMWTPCPKSNYKPAGSKVWRTVAKMGFGDGNGCSGGAEVCWLESAAEPAAADVVVVSDGGMGFRDDQMHWPDQAVLATARWIVLKTADPLAEGELWARLAGQQHRDRLVVVVSSDALRKTRARVNAGLSWDATLASVLEEIAPGKVLADLANCRHLLVMFGSEGGLWLDMQGSNGQPVAHFLYDADSIEGEGRRDQTGEAFGALSCLTAVVAWQLAAAGDEDLESAVEGGLLAAADLFENGHGPGLSPGQGFPAARLAKAAWRASCRYSRTVFPASAVTHTSPCPEGKGPKEARGCWSIVRVGLRGMDGECDRPAYDLAARVVTRGPIALESLPHLAIGKLVSADREEIEALRTVRQLIVDYRDHNKGRKPLSIGVFGPPGAGKSFAVKEVAKALIGPDDFERSWLEFNLSQFNEGTGDLIGAFHQIRDVALGGLTPFAFFDEFDSRDYRWLQYLLAPMQDGAFQEGQITHPIGKCILIFAGGTSATFDSFGPPQDKDGEDDPAFKMLKGPDFKSRLDGFIDVMGPNRRQIVKRDEGTGRWRKSPDGCDVFFPVRRALIIRSELGCKPSDRVRIDARLLDALLTTKEYKHGARSMSKILEALRRDGGAEISRSLLPARTQLALHVSDPDSFLTDQEPPQPALPRPHWDLATREHVAAAIHATFRALGTKQGWIQPENDQEYAALTHFQKESNRAAADRMLELLAMVGLFVEPGEPTEAERLFARRLIEENLDLLAEKEHAGWRKWHEDRGWQWAPETDKANLKQKCLVDYEALSEEDKNKDRSQVRNFPDFGEAAGMKIVP